MTRSKQNKGKKVKLHKNFGELGSAPDITIERVLWDAETGHLTSLDVHNEANGYAYFLEVVGRHHHGKRGITKVKKKHG